MREWEEKSKKVFGITKDRKLYQITEYTSAKDIEVWEHFNGSVNLVGNGRKLKHKLLKELPRRNSLKFKPKPIKNRLKNLKSSFGTIGVRKNAELTVA